MTEFELIFMGFVFGFLMAMFFLWVGAFAGEKGIMKRDKELEKPKEKPVNDEEINMVIDNFRIGACQYEKRVLDAIKERMGLDAEQE